MSPRGVFPAEGLILRVSEGSLRPFVALLLGVRGRKRKETCRE